ncbi:MAG TPA: class I SAM-dependent RNA methyltransferase [Flexilinea sp.]|nr:class I SAM-dependent RNA methyltransferase [Flexilinea sp.]
MPSETQRVKVHLTALTYEGMALGHLPDGRVVFVAGGLPDEEVEIEITGEKRDFVFARVIQILRPSVKRISPKCPHFGTCGGCHFQHLNYVDQLSVKRSIVEEQLRRIGGIQNPVVGEVVPSPEIWQYRNTMQFHINSEGQICFRKAGSMETVPIHECYLPAEPIRRLFPSLVFGPSDSGKRIEIRCDSDRNLMLIEEGHRIDLSDRLAGGSSPTTQQTDSSEKVESRKKVLFMDVLGVRFQVSAGSFFQVNLPVAEAMIRYLQNNLPLDSKTNLFDLYCGAGLFSRFFAEKVAHIDAIELSTDAASDFAANLAGRGAVSFRRGAVEQVLPQFRIRGGAVILDPPRSGLKPRALDAIVRIAPSLIAYVSCDPATLARDLRSLLAVGYRLERITPFDMFPQTYHVETVVLMSRKDT